MLNVFQAETRNHYAQARALFGEYAEWLGHDLGFQRFSEELAGLPGAYAPPSGCLLLATYGDELAGCVALRKHKDKICEMKRLYVRPELRRRGIGRRLAAEVVEVSKRVGYEHMWLDTLDYMEPARALYRSLGFREIAPYYDNPIAGAVFFELDLTERPR